MKPTRIDMHAHFFPRITREEADAADPRAPWLTESGDGRGQIMQGDKPFRPVQQQLWDGKLRLAWMDQHGVDQQIVCATPVMFGYAWDTARAAPWCARMNEHAISYCSADASRLKALAQVPLQDTDAACRELERAKAIGHIGVQIGNHVGERSLDDPGILDFLRHCAALSMPVLVHPWDLMGDGRMKKWMLPWLVSMPAETQLGMLSLVLSGSFERLPRDLNIIFAHGGGSFAWLIGRVDNAWKHRDIIRADCPQLPSSYCDRMMVDSAVFDPGALRHLVNTMGRSQVMFGTDSPFPLGEQQPGALVESTFAEDADLREQILAGNARRVFGL